MEHFLATCSRPTRTFGSTSGCRSPNSSQTWSSATPTQALRSKHGETDGSKRSRWPIAGTADLIAELLGAGLRVVGLSNFSAETFALVRRPNDAFDATHDIVLSGHHGVAKPDPAIFELLCKRNAVQPHNVVFFDDAVGNVTAAARLGFHSRLFTDAATARHDLVELRVLAIRN